MIVHIVELSFFVAPADWQNAMSNNFSRLSQNLAVFTADLPRLEALDPSSIKRVQSRFNFLQRLCWDTGVIPEVNQSLTQHRKNFLARSILAMFQK